MVNSQYIVLEMVERYWNMVESDEKYNVKRKKNVQCGRTYNEVVESCEFL